VGKISTKLSNRQKNICRDSLSTNSPNTSLFPISKISGYSTSKTIPKSNLNWMNLFIMSSISGIYWVFRKKFIKSKTRRTSKLLNVWGKSTTDWRKSAMTGIRSKCIWCGCCFASLPKILPFSIKHSFRISLSKGLTKMEATSPLNWMSCFRCWILHVKIALKILTSSLPNFLT